MSDVPWKSNKHAGVKPFEGLKCICRLGLLSSERGQNFGEGQLRLLLESWTTNKVMSLSIWPDNLEYFHRSAIHYSDLRGSRSNTARTNSMTCRRKEYERREHHRQKDLQARSVQQILIWVSPTAQVHVKVYLLHKTKIRWIMGNMTQSGNTTLFTSIRLKAGPSTPHLYTMTCASDRFTNNRWRA